MDAVASLLALVVLAAVIWLVSAPLRAQAAGRKTPAQERDEQRRIDLEIERDQKYAEIRELEMDLRTGKLSDQDYRATDRQLRAEAVDILHALDRLGVTSEAAPGAGPLSAGPEGDAPDEEPTPTAPVGDGDAPRPR